MKGFPRLDEWLGFGLAVLVALALIRTVENRVFPGLSTVESGL